MKILFIQNWKWPQLGILTLSAILEKKSYDTEVLIQAHEKDILKEILKSNPDIIGLYASENEFPWANKLSKDIKKISDILIVLGGTSPTFNPEEIIKEKSFDAICVGSGEISFPKFVDAVKNNKNKNKIKGMWTRNKNKLYKNGISPAIEDIENFPIPNWSLYEKYKKHIKNLNVITQRGCPFSCNFCIEPSYRKLYGKKYHQRKSIEKSIKEIKEGLKFKDFNLIYFLDSTFTLNKDWVLKFLKRYKEEISIPFICCARLDCVDDDIASALYSAGCLFVYVGVESGTERVRNNILNKKLPNKTIFKGIDILKKNKLKVISFNILLSPSETKEDMAETILLNRKLKTNMSVFYFLNVFKGTNLNRKKGHKTVRNIREEISSPPRINKKWAQNLSRLSLLFVKVPYSFELISPFLEILPSPITKIIYKISRKYESAYISVSKYTKRISLKIKGIKF